MFECHARILHRRLGLLRFGQFEVKGPVVQLIEEIDQSFPVVVKQLTERHVLHRNAFGVSHVEQRIFLQSLPLPVGRKERSHARFITENPHEEFVKTAQRHIVGHFEIADEIIVFVAQHTEFEYHRHIL